jgi:hypothetical protein
MQKSDNRSGIQMSYNHLRLQLPLLLLGESDPF